MMPLAGSLTVAYSSENCCKLAEDTIVSPANSYRFMDGGIDDLYIKFFGLPLQTTLQKVIGKRSEGYLPVGCAEVINTNHRRIPYMIAAPTMVTPEAIPSQNCFYAMIAVLNLASRHSYIRKIFAQDLVQVSVVLHQTLQPRRWQWLTVSGCISPKPDNSNN